jgi:hypothetical protein
MFGANRRRDSLLSLLFALNDSGGALTTLHKPTMKVDS